MFDILVPEKGAFQNLCVLYVVYLLSVRDKEVLIPFDL